MSRLSRRKFLKVASLSAIALTASCRADTAARPTPTPAHSSVSPTTSPPTTDLRQAPTEIELTPTEKFYRQSYRLKPEVDPEQWRLTIDGLVEAPAVLTLDEIKALPAVVEMRTLECIGNPVGGSLIGNALWKGVYLPTALAARGVKVKSSAIRANFEAADGYTTSHDLKWVLQPDILLIYEMNGEPLARDHGFPLRLLMPGLYGQKNPKWLTRIEFTDTETLGYWERQEWSDVAEVRTNSIIRQPAAQAKLPAATVPIFGLAFAGKRQIASVEVRVDDGAWQPAQLVQAESNLVWTQWSFDWPATDGKHKIAVRATDEKGFTQTETSGSLLREAFPNGTASIHSVLVRVIPE